VFLVDISDSRHWYHLSKPFPGMRIELTIPSLPLFSVLVRAVKESASKSFVVFQSNYDHIWSKHSNSSGNLSQPMMQSVSNSSFVNKSKLCTKLSIDFQIKIAQPFRNMLKLFGISTWRCHPNIKKVLTR